MAALGTAAAVLGLLGSYIIAKRTGWEGRVIVYLIGLSLLETVGVTTWLWVAHGWKPQGGAVVEWLGVLCGFVLLNEFGYWLIRDEFERPTRNGAQKLKIDEATFAANRDKLLAEARNEALRPWLPWGAWMRWSKEALEDEIRVHKAVHRALQDALHKHAPAVAEDVISDVAQKATEWLTAAHREHKQRVPEPPRPPENPA